ncbi:MAG: hypothetical protein AVDCRST_MAG14-174 [uncultured Rubrobacteraceae bacterium]|uniref:Uncharacterized protein n=1 Tax=uncultured Rubrobacteraceae bacterium TaxID=349277 RepID=A0A6J4QGQ5_9ACTN|nr:MAG: hypothetical protein AVDCRST_MAG14-174 [uncultured Rubrobacteraceae bacterium]
MLEPVFYFLLGLVIGRWWVLVVAVGLYWLHGLAVYLGIWSGSISTWSALQWWIFIFFPLVGLTGIGVLIRVAIRRAHSWAMAHRSGNPRG